MVPSSLYGCEPDGSHCTSHLHTPVATPLFETDRKLLTTVFDTSTVATAMQRRYGDRLGRGPQAPTTHNSSFSLIDCCDCDCCCFCRASLLIAYCCLIDRLELLALQCVRFSSIVRLFGGSSSSSVAPLGPFAINAEGSRAKVDGLDGPRHDDHALCCLSFTLFLFVRSYHLSYDS